MSPGITEAIIKMSGGGGGDGSSAKPNKVTESVKMSKEAIPSVSNVDGNNKKDSSSKPGVDNNADFLYFSVDKITEQDLKNVKQKKVEVNGESIALISHENKIFAIQEKCPHAGGPLIQGDIEDLPTHGLCIRCPWHAWKFSLSTGKCVSPQNREDKCITIYPVKTSKESKDIKIGFEKISNSIFSTPPQ